MNASGLCGRIGHRNNPGGHHPWISRDYESVHCEAVGCRWNVLMDCGVPTRHKVTADGRCGGFEVKVVLTKVNGD